MVMDAREVENVVAQIAKVVSPEIRHNDTIGQIEQIFRKNGYYTTKEYPIYRMKDKPERMGRIDLIARRGKLRVAVEYDHHGLIKWKSFQKMVQIKPEAAIGITGNGKLEPNMERAGKYIKNLKCIMYIVSLKDRAYKYLK